MLRNIFVAIILTATFGSAQARQVMLTTEQSFLILDVLLNKMDTYEKIVTEGGKDRVVKTFYQLEGNTRMAIARNIAALQVVTKAAEKARIDLIAAVSEGTGKVTEDTMPKLNAEWRKILDAESGINLVILTEGELRLKDNPWPPSLLAALLPILAELP